MEQIHKLKIKIKRFNYKNAMDTAVYKFKTYLTYNMYSYRLATLGLFLSFNM